MILWKWINTMMQQTDKQQNYSHHTVLQLTAHLLLRVDHKHFQELQNSIKIFNQKHTLIGLQVKQELMFQSQQLEIKQKQDLMGKILSLIDSYLCIKEMKKISARALKQVHTRLDMEQLMALTLFVSVNSNLNNEVVQVVLELSQQEQLELMSHIQQVEQICQKLVQFSKVVEQIVILEQDNDSLKNKAVQQLAFFETQKILVCEKQAENNQLSKQIDRYEQERQNVLRQLNIGNINQFVQICSQMKKQTVKIATNVQQQQQDNINRQFQNLKLRKNLKQCGKTIKIQIDQIEKLKQMCTLLKSDPILRNDLSPPQQSIIPLLPLKQSFNRQNQLNSSRGKIKFPTDRTNYSLERSCMEQSFQNRNNLHLLLSLNNLQKEEELKRKQIAILIQSNEFEKSKREKAHHCLKKIKTQHVRQMQAYELTKTVNNKY